MNFRKLQCKSRTHMLTCMWAIWTGAWVLDLELCALQSDGAGSACRDEERTLSLSGWLNQGAVVSLSEWETPWSLLFSKELVKTYGQQSWAWEFQEPWILGEAPVFTNYRLTWLEERMAGQGQGPKEHREESFFSQCLDSILSMSWSPLAPALTFYHLPYCDWISWI